ncbi:hypothetical protein SESBI_05425 [Sesbania bispinosa]|nr:hypothetical protein SESBI_05425 [Sesbania bispinosa]
MNDDDYIAFVVLVLSTSIKQADLFVVAGFSKDDGVEIAMTDGSYVQVDGDDSDSSSDDSELNLRFDDSAGDGDYEDHFEDNVNLNTSSLNLGNREGAGPYMPH